jgi:hypothetical protein
VNTVHELCNNLYIQFPGKGIKEMNDLTNYNWSVLEWCVRECDTSTSHVEIDLIEGKRSRNVKMFPP